MMAGCEHYEAIVCKYGYRSICKQNLHSEAVYGFGRKKERKKTEISSDFSFKKSLLDAFLLKVNSREKRANETKKIEGNIQFFTWIMNLISFVSVIYNDNLLMTCKFGELKTFVQFATLHAYTRTRAHTHTHASSSRDHVPVPTLKIEYILHKASWNHFSTDLFIAMNCLNSSWKSENELSYNFPLRKSYFCISKQNF